MRYALIGDIHSNLEAFTEVKRQLEKEEIDKYICLGDIVGYGANPKECIKIARKLFDCLIAGNHDWAAAGRFDASRFNPYARQAVQWTEDILESEDKRFLRSLPLRMEIDDFEIVHGSLYHPDEFNYILNEAEAEKSFNLMKTRLLFIGHSHAPAILIKKNLKVIEQVPSSEIELDFENKYIVNVGSVGQPRDGNPRACFCIFDEQKRTIQIKRLEYRVALTQEKIINAGLPHFLAVRLAGGR
jgi:predicted phosphodiesterase